MSDEPLVDPAHEASGDPLRNAENAATARDLERSVAERKLSSPLAFPPDAIDRFRAYAVGFARYAAERGELPPELDGKTPADVERMLETWFREQRGNLAVATIDTALLMLDRAVGRYVPPAATVAAIALLSPDELLEYQEGRAAALEARVAQTIGARRALIEAMSGSLRLFLTIGLAALLESSGIVARR